MQPASHTNGRPATYEDVLRAPENMIAELINGELVLSPRPATPHARAAGKLYGRLDDLFDAPTAGPRGVPGGWWILYEPELHIGGHILVPDICGWRRAHMAQIPNAAAITQVPDWICEGLSPSTARHDRFIKMNIYAKLGVPNVWLADPIVKAIEAYRLVDGAWLRVGTGLDEKDARLAPFEAAPLDLSEMWLGGTNDEESAH